MDRLIISHKFIGDLQQALKIASTSDCSERLAYTGMDICEESSLQYDVCAGPLSRNIGMAASHPRKREILSNWDVLIIPGLFAQPVYSEILFAVNKKLEASQSISGK